MATRKQDARQRQRSFSTGKYEKFPPCNGCGKAMGPDYASHPMSDCPGDDGINWADTALVLCDRCYCRTDHMRNVSEFVRYRETGWY